MLRIRRLVGMLAVLAMPATAANAQYFYPGGYGGWGWNGWGGGGETVQGSVARGLGMFAAGAGVYNEKTAVANSINADTAMRWNQYLWLSQQEANRRYQAKLARDRQGNTQAREAIANRLRNNPEPGDITRGDALNVALDEVLNPRVYVRGLKAAGSKVAGTTIRDIPFQYASAAITTSVDQLTQGGPPEALKAEAFASDRETLKKLAAEIRKQNEEEGKFDPASLQKARDVIHTMREKVEATMPRGTRQRTESERYLKALFGLTKMLETPAVDVLLAGVENRPNTTLGDLVSFMSSFNLRFGVANTPRQREVYQSLYPLMVTLRDEASASIASNTAAAEPSTINHPADFFAGMPLEHLDPRTSKATIPPPPAKP